MFTSAQLCKISWNMLCVPALFKAGECIVSATIRLIIHTGAHSYNYRTISPRYRAYYRYSCNDAAIGECHTSKRAIFSASFSRTRGAAIDFAYLELYSLRPGTKCIQRNTLAKRRARARVLCIGVKPWTFLRHQLNWRLFNLYDRYVYYYVFIWILYIILHVSTLAS